MRILFLNFKKFWGGGEKMACALASGVQSRGHSVCFLVKPDTPLESRLRELAVEVHPVAYRNPVKLAATFFGHGPYDAIVTWSEQELRYAYYLSLFSGTPVITRLGVSALPPAGRYKRWLHNRTVAVNFVNFRQGVAMLTAAYGPHINHPVFLPNGLAPAPEKIEDLRPKLGIPPGGLVLGMAGRLEARKGCRLLFSAFHTLADRYPDLHLLVVGTGGLAEELKAQSHDRIHVLDFMKNIWGVLKCMDLFVLPVLWGEGTSNAVLEAMHLGIPAITTADGGLADIVRHEETGLIVAKGSRQALEQAIIRLIEDEPLRERLGTAAAALVNEHYTMDVMVDRFLQWAGRPAKETRKQQ